MQIFWSQDLSFSKFKNVRLFCFAHIKDVKLFSEVSLGKQTLNLCQAFVVASLHTGKCQMFDKIIATF